MNFKLNALIVLFISFSTLSNAAVTVSGQVSMIYPSGKYVYFRLKDDACHNNSSRYFYFKNNEADNDGKYASKNWYSLLLMSATTKIPVSVSIEECDVNSHIEIRFLYQKY